MKFSKKTSISLIADLFREHGYHGTTYSLIEKASGLGKGSLYHHFDKGKEGIALAVLEGVQNWFEENIFLPLENKSANLATLEKTISSVIEFFHDGKRVCVPGSFALHDSRDLFPEQVLLYFSRWIDSLSTFITCHGIAKKESQVLATDTIMLIQGALVVSRSQNNPSLFAEAVKRSAEKIKKRISQAKKYH